LDVISKGGIELYDAYAGSTIKMQMYLKSPISSCEADDSCAAAKALAVPKVPPLLTQFHQLILRETRVSLREPGLAAWHYGSALFAGLLFGCAYRSLELNLVGVISRIGLFFAIQCILGMQALQSLMAWREGHTGFLRERKAAYYSTGPFVLAKAVVDGLLLRVGPPLLLGVVLYPLAGLHGGRIVTFLTALCLASLTSSTFCLWIGAMSPRSAVGLPLAVLSLLIFLLFGGVMLSDAPAWLASMSYFRASYNMLVTNEFLGLTFDFDPQGIEKDFDALPGAEWLRLLHFTVVPNATNIAVLISYSVGFVCLAWATLSMPRCRGR